MPNKSSGTIRLRPKYFVISMLLFLFPLFFYLEMNASIPLIMYYDEVITIACAIYIFYLIIVKRLVDREDVIAAWLSIIIAVITLISNLNSRLITAVVPITTDMIALFKITFPYLAGRYIVKEDKNRYSMLYLLPAAKVTLITATFFGTLSLFVNIGMSGEKRYGIPSFMFIFRNEGRLGLIAASCLLIILIHETNKRKINAYEFMATLVFIYTTKGTVYIIPIAYYLLKIFSRRGKKLSWKNIGLIAAGVIAGSSFQIRTYLLDDESPRMRLLRHGFITANDYFPFGSGFATYGSDMALKNYSPLYVKYGFEQLYGMSSTNGAFLNDCYLGMVFGEFGYFGALLFIVMLVLLFSDINRFSFERAQVKFLCIAIFLCQIISCTGSAMIKSSIGVFSFVTLGIAAGYMRNEMNARKGTIKNPLPYTKLKVIVH